MYAELSEQCQKYACDLLEQCRSSEEVIAVLNKSKYSPSADDDDEEDTYEGGVDEPVDERDFDEIEDDVDSPHYDDDADDDDDCAAEKITLDRFKLALKYEQKQVDHPRPIQTGTQVRAETGRSATLDRFKLALKYEQKQVDHPRPIQTCSQVRAETGR